MQMANIPRHLIETGNDLAAELIATVKRIPDQGTRNRLASLLRQHVGINLLVTEETTLANIEAMRKLLADAETEAAQCGVQYSGSTANPSQQYEF